MRIIGRVGLAFISKRNGAAMRNRPGKTVSSVWCGFGQALATIRNPGARENLARATQQAVRASQAGRKP